MDPLKSGQITVPLIIMLMLASGLISSLLTVTVTKIFDIWQKKIEHKHSLGRTLFEHKLAVAESAISQRFIFLSSLANYLAILNTMSENLAMILASPPEFMQKMLEDANQKLAKLSEPAFNAANAASLFFDVVEQINIGAIKEYMDLCISIDASSKHLFLLASLFAQSKIEGEKQKMQAVAAELIAKMQADIKKVSATFEKGYNEVIENISHIRREIKKYEA